MHFSDFSRSSDSSGSREARASMVRLLSYWQYYHRKISPSLESFIHLWSQGFYLSSIIKSSPSSSHYHHVITIIIKSTSPYHHVITIIITSSPQSVKITFIIASAGKIASAEKVLKPRREKREKRWFKPNPWSDGFDSKYIWVRWDPLMINTALMPSYLWKRWGATFVTHNTPTIRK